MAAGAHLAATGIQFRPQETSRRQATARLGDSVPWTASLEENQELRQKPNNKKHLIKKRQLSECLDVGQINLGDLTMPNTEEDK